MGSYGIVKDPPYSHRVAIVEQRIGFLLYEYYCFLTVEGGILLFSTLKKWFARVFEATQNVFFLRWRITFYFSLFM